MEPLTGHKGRGAYLLFRTEEPQTAGEKVQLVAPVRRRLREGNHFQGVRCASASGAGELFERVMVLLGEAKPAQIIVVLGSAAASTRFANKGNKASETYWSPTLLMRPNGSKLGKRCVPRV